jgi:hypothetical protein
MRHPHLLRENKGARLPVLLMAFDTETDSIPIADDAVEARLRFGWLAITRRHRGLHWTPTRWRRFETPDEFWDFVESEIRDEWRAYLCAHNLGFDWRVTDGFGQLPKRGWELKGAVIDDPPTILRWHAPRRGLIALDTLNYYRMPLRDIGKTFGLDKLDHDLKWGDREKDDAYCKRDAEIVLSAMQGIIRRTAELDLGNFAPTFPSLAFGAFRHRHLQTPVLIDDNPKALALARKSYVGGRTEAFRIGRIRGPVDVYDFVSMYPSVMRTEPMPTVLRGVYRSMTVAELAVAATDAAPTADVTLDTDQADYPVIRDDRLIFPVGRFRTVLSAPELRHALQFQRVTKVHEVALYDQAVLFASYIDEWWQRRKEALAAGDASEADFCKRMMNALYGKFGQSGRVFETLGDAENGEVRSWTEIDMETGAVWRMRSLAGLLQRQSGEIESRDSHPAIAATVTSAARLRLLQAMIKAGRSSVLYVDTDSIFLPHSSIRSISTLETGTDLGQLKLERTIRQLTIYGLKDYEADGVRKTKGIRKTAEEIEPGVYRQDLFVGLKGAIAAGDINRQIIKSVEKRLSGAYSKGDVSPTGVVTPYRLGD